MKKPWTKAILSVCALGALLAGLQGCAAEDPSEDSDPESIATESVPVASLALENGNTLEFHDLGSAAIVAERGQAYSSLIFQKQGDSEPLSSVWRRYAKGLPVPPVLEALQRRLDSSAATSASASPEAEPQVAIKQTLQDPDPSLSAAPRDFTKSHCGNGCCNRQWLEQTFPICRNGSRNFFFLDEPSPVFNRRNVIQMNTFICAASATRYEVIVDKKAPAYFSLGTAQFMSFPIVKLKQQAWPQKPFARHTVETAARTVGHDTTTYCGFFDVDNS